MTRSLFKDSRRPYFWCERTLLRLGCSAIEIALYCVLADCANEKDCCWPSYSTLAERLGIGRRTAMRGIKRLCQKGAVHKSTRINPDTGKPINIYELVDLPGETATAPARTGDTTVTGDSHDTAPVTPVSPHRCQKGPSNKEPLNKEPRNKGGASACDPLWEYFCSGFQHRHGHCPRMTPKQRSGWVELKSLHPDLLLRAKIDAWWTHPLPSTFRGNRAVGAFLQWFDDIPVNGSRPASGRVLTPEQWRDEMSRATALGKSHLVELIGEVADPDARQRTLVSEGVAHDADDAAALIAAFTSE